MSYTIFIDGKEFIKKVKKLAKHNGIDITVTEQGKGSHKTLFYGTTFTRVKMSGEIGPGLLNAMCKQIGIKKEDL